MMKSMIVGMALMLGLLVSGCDTTQGSTDAKSGVCPVTKKACKAQCTPEQIAACKKACEGLSPEECKAKCVALKGDCGGKAPSKCAKKASQCSKKASECPKKKAQCAKKKACPPGCTKPCCAKKSDEAKACPPNCAKPCCAS